jgi:hypothetical protein
MHFRRTQTPATALLQSRRTVVSKEAALNRVQCCHSTPQRYRASLATAAVKTGRGPQEANLRLRLAASRPRPFAHGEQQHRRRPRRRCVSLRSRRECLQCESRQTHVSKSHRRATHDRRLNLDDFAWVRLPASSETVPPIAETNCHRCVRSGPVVASQCHPL